MPQQAAQAPAAASAAPAVNPQTGQPDYTAAWVEYYRRQGMHEQANAILRKSQPGAQPQVRCSSTYNMFHVLRFYLSLFSFMFASRFVTLCFSTKGVEHYIISPSSS